MVAVAIPEVDAAEALELAIQVADEVLALLQGNLEPDQRKKVEEILARCNAIQETLEDALDSLEADAALREAKAKGTVPWGDIKAEHNL